MPNAIQPRENSKGGDTGGAIYIFCNPDRKPYVL